MATIFPQVQQVQIVVNGVMMSAQDIQIVHNPRSFTCKRRVWNEPWEGDQFCDACDPPVYARRSHVRPVCMYCWKPLVPFEPLPNYKGPASAWTHVTRLTQEKTFTKVTCHTKQSGPRVPRAIPGRLIIQEPELMLENALRENG